MLTAAASEPLIWDDAAETIAREQLATIQLERLRETIARVLKGQPLGAARLADGGDQRPGRRRTLDDLPKLPFAHKTDLRENYPFGLLAVPREEIVRVQASSGSHGKPTVVGYTRADLESWTELMARSMTMAGVRPGMLIHNANGYGLFTGGLGFHQGGERIGATVVPVSGGQTARQAMLIRDFGANVLVATPSYSLVIAQALQDAGVAPEDNAPRARTVRRRAVDRRPQNQDRQRARDQGDQLLRPVGDVRSRGRDRMPDRARRAPRAGGPLPGRGDRPRRRHSRCPTGPTASLCSRR